MKIQPLSWKQLGDVVSGRPNLGLYASVQIYRLLQYSMRVAMEDEWDEETAQRLLKKSGKIAGIAFAQEFIDKKLPLNRFLAQLQLKFEELGIGILKIEKSNKNASQLIVTISEDLDCSGLPVNGITVCDFDEGFMEGIFEYYTDKTFSVVEIDCWSTGDRTCRFKIDAVEA